MGVLAMLELEGDTAALLAAAAQIDRLRPAPEGLLVRITAPTDDGMVLFQLWESQEARTRNAEDPSHTGLLEESGMLAAVRGSRSRAFEPAELQVFG